MKGAEKTSDIIFARPPHFSVHYRGGRRLRWGGEARTDYGVLLLLEGILRWETGDDVIGQIVAGGSLLAAPGDRLQAHGSGPSAFLAVTLSPLFVLDCATRAKMLRSGAFVSFPTHAVQADARLTRLARDLADELSEGAMGQEVVITALVEQTLIHLLRRYANIRRSDHLELSRAGLVDRRIRRAVELMHAHLDRELPLEEIAAAAHLSSFHFARLFKKLTGVSPHAYLASLRVARAQTLLAETDLSITEIGALVGYASPSHFAKAFRQATSISPRAFRKAAFTRMEGER